MENYQESRLERIKDRCGCLLSGALMALTFPFLIPAIYLAFKEPSVKIRPRFRKPTIKFYERQLKRAEDVIFQRERTAAIFSDPYPAPPLNLSDIHYKKRQLLEKVIPLYEAEGLGLKAERARHKLSQLEAI